MEDRSHEQPPKMTNKLITLPLRLRSDKGSGTHKSADESHSPSPEMTGHHDMKTKVEEIRRRPDLAIVKLQSPQCKAIRLKSPQHDEVQRPSGSSSKSQAGAQVSSSSFLRGFRFHEPTFMEAKEDEKANSKRNLQVPTTPSSEVVDYKENLYPKFSLAAGTATPTQTSTSAPTPSSGPYNSFAATRPNTSPGPVRRGNSMPAALGETKHEKNKKRPFHFMTDEEYAMHTSIEESQRYALKMERAHQKQRGLYPPLAPLSDKSRVSKSRRHWHPKQQGISNPAFEAARERRRQRLQLYDPSPMKEVGLGLDEIPYSTPSLAEWERQRVRFALGFRMLDGMNIVTDEQRAKERERMELLGITCDEDIVQHIMLQKTADLAGRPGPVSSMDGNVDSDEDPDDRMVMELEDQKQKQVSNDDGDVQMEMYFD